MDAARHLAHLCREAGSALPDAGASLLWEESPDGVCCVPAALRLMLSLHETVKRSHLAYIRLNAAALQLYLETGRSQFTAAVTFKGAYHLLPLMPEF